MNVYVTGDCVIVQDLPSTRSARGIPNRAQQERSIRPSTRPAWDPEM